MSPSHRIFSTRAIVIFMIFSAFQLKTIYCQNAGLTELELAWKESSTISDSISDGIDVAKKFYASNIDNARAIITALTTLAEAHGDSALIYDVRFAQGKQLMFQRNQIAAIKLFEKYATYQYNAGDSSQYYLGLLSIGDVHTRLGNFDKGEENLKKALAYYESSGDKRKAGVTSRGIGNLLRRQGKFDQALLNYHKAYDIFNELGKEKDTGALHNPLGITYARIGDKKKAEYHFRGSLVHAKNFGGESRVGSALANISTVLADKDSIESYLLRSMQIFEDINVSVEVARRCFSLGMLYEKNDRLEEAINFLNRSKREFKKSKQPELPQINVRLALAYSKLGKRKESLKFLDENLDFVENIPDKDGRSDYIEVIAQTYYHLGDIENTWKFRKEAENLKDSILNESRLNAIADIEKSFEVKQKNLEIEKLKIEDELNNVQLSRQRLGLFGSIGALGFLGFFFQRLRKSNILIKKQNSEKEVLLKEIHHRVKNNLQVISSLLGLQSLSVKDEAARLAINEGRSRVHSMSLIHQNLYKKDNLTGIEMPAYINKLSKNLISTYQLSDQEIDLVIDVDKITLDVETVVPIGLIINELITNSLKYAFIQRKGGKIGINLKEDHKILQLKVWDDGIGLTSDQLSIKEDSFGHSLIRAFKDKLEADIAIDIKNGTAITLDIKNYKLAM